jgi:CRISPR/Cas system CSM-associated protein Csm2 small subunit
MASSQTLVNFVLQNLKMRIARELSRDGKISDEFFEVINSFIKKARGDQWILVDERNKRIVKRVGPVKNRKNVIRVITGDNKRRIYEIKKFEYLNFQKCEVWDIINREDELNFKLERLGISV